MQKVIALLLFSLLISSNLVVGQGRLLKKANRHYENLAYKDAISSYEKIVDAGNADFNVYQKLGDSYYFNSNYKDALVSYKKMLLIKKDVPAEYYSRAASALRNSQDFEGSDKLLDELQALKDAELKASKLSKVPDYIRDITANSGRYTIENIGTNTNKADFAPAFFKDQLVFSSARGNGYSTEAKNKWTGQAYLTLIKATIMEDGQLFKPEVFSNKLNAQLHESTAAFTKDGNTVYFTKNNVEGLGFKSDSIGKVRLKIYKAKMNENGNWSDVEELPFNDDNYSVAHPALNADETKLYFASDMPGTRGMSDIYSVTINSDGSYSVPANLGSKINTDRRETFPFLSKSGILYFASDGHSGLGGLDIFATGEPLNNNIINLGEPVNSPADDVTFIINEDTNKGYFASNRKGGKGDDDLYSFEEHKSLLDNCFGNFELVVLDEKSNLPISGSLIEIKNADDEIVVSGETDENGMLVSNFNCGDIEYTIQASKENHITKSQIFNSSSKDTKPSIEVKLYNIAPQLGANIIDILGLENVLFKLNKTEILERNEHVLNQIADYLHKYPNIYVQINSHSDSRGQNDYNLKLSQDRSIATSIYLMRNGIDQERLILHGKGEDIMVNRCINDVDCDEEEHTLNRRAEFIIVKL